MINKLRCFVGVPSWITIDPTGGDPAMGGPVNIEVCSRCKVQRGYHA